MADEMTVIHEYPIDEMPKRRLLELFRQGAKLYKICQNTSCDVCQRYTPIDDDRELMTYCLKCGTKVLLYGVESKA